MSLRKVLIVSEDPLLQGKIADILRDEGYYVVVVRDRNLALNCLEQEEINIILAEEEILAKEGFQFLRSVRGRFSEVVVLAVGSSDNP
ncbi:MAG: response regulator, partial [Candidatus Atribacteria bacterium]|nr:response regulator [Candidatus Atribacteria bacterium]MCD6349548.1 response regulator [Candidatus Atribacteria bacterium]